MPEKKYKLCYPQLGNYDIPIQYFVNNGLHLEYLAPPAMTKRTIELGAKYSPDFQAEPGYKIDKEFNDWMSVYTFNFQ